MPMPVWVLMKSSLNWAWPRSVAAAKAAPATWLPNATPPAPSLHCAKRQQSLPPAPALCELPMLLSALVGSMFLVALAAWWIFRF